MRCILIALVLMVGVTIGQDSINVSRIGVWDEQYAKALVMSGQFAYVIPGGALSVIDVSNPCSPQTTAYVDVNNAEDVAMEGNYLYIACGLDGLRIFDVQDPSTPASIATFDPGRVYDVAVRDHIAYIAASNAGLYVLDVSDPHAPFQIGYFDVVGTSQNISVVGNYAYIAVGQLGLRIIDISNPAMPTEVGFVDDDQAGVNSFLVSGHYAFLGRSLAGLAIVDISNIANPVFVASIDSLDYPEDFAIHGNHLYAAVSEYGLVVIDVSDPGDPEVLGYYYNSGIASAVAASGDFVYFCDFFEFDILDCLTAFATATPLPPLGLTVQFQPQTTSLALHWFPVSSDILGAPVDIRRYEIFAATLASPNTWQCVGIPFPPDTTFFLDSSTLLNNRLYHVRAVAE
ncbi:MAG: hypothetical protein IPK53_04045 [bacterium]|nr:hypothetical protein [bacterium]